MRALILAASAAMAISACGKNDGAAGSTTNVDQDLAAQNISANDTTAIDAATGDDANMAADVQFTANESLDGSADDTTSNAN